MTIKTENFLHYPASEDLLKYGAYYFKIFFAPTYDSSLAKTDYQNTAKIKDTLKTLAARSSSGDSSTFSSFWNLLAGKLIQEVFLDVSSLKNFIDAASNMGALTTQDLYEKQNRHVAHIMLPLNKYTIRRESGVVPGGTEGIYKNYFQALQAKVFENMLQRNESMQKQIFSGEGMFQNKMLGHSMANIQFETYDLEWDLLARSKKEMEQIRKILVFFNGACLTSVNLNDRNNLLYILPPHVEMGILTTDMSQPSQTGELFNFEDATQSAATDIGAAVTQSTGRVKYLKPKMLYYITSIQIDCGDSGTNGVFLAPSGDPMMVKLTVRLVKVNHTTTKDLFRKDNTKGTGRDADGKEIEEDFGDAEKIEDANPYV